jgi:tetratricopeptide (TPR) repeat protein
MKYLWLGIMLVILSLGAKAAEDSSEKVEGLHEQAKPALSPAAKAADESSEAVERLHEQAKPALSPATKAAEDSSEAIERLHEQAKPALSPATKAAEVSPQDIDRLHKEAKQAFFAADYATALAKWETALNHARALDQKADISKFLVNLAAVNYSLGLYQKALDYYQQALVIDKELGDKSAESADLSSLGLVYYNLGQYPKALKSYQQALAIQKAVADKNGQSNSLGNLGMVYDSLGDYHKALEYYQQALAIKKEIGDSSGVANNLSNMGVAYKNLSDYPNALAHFQQALQKQKQLGDLSGIANNLTNIGTVYDSLGQYRKALRYYRQALRLQNNIGDISGIANNLSNLGVVYDNLGQYRKALSSYRQALQIQGRLGDQRGIGNNLSNIGVVYKNMGDLQKALTHYQQALGIQSHIGDRRGEANSLTNLAVVYNSLGQYPKALTHYLQALDIQRQLGEKQRIGNNLSNLGVLYYNLGQSDKALGYFLQALTLRRELGDKRGEGIDLSNLGAVYDSIGQRSKALKSYQQALAIRRDIGDKRGEAVDLSNLGAMYGNLEKYQEALAHFQQALAIDREIGDKIGEAADLSNLGLIYQQLGQDEKARTDLQASVTILQELGTNNLWYAQRGLAAVEVQLNEIDTAISHYEHALESIEKLRAGLTEKADKLSFMQDKLYVYDEFITLLQRLHDEQPDKGYDRKALEIFERKQGRVFLEEIGKSGAQRFARLPYKIVKQEHSLTHKTAKLQAELVQARNKPFIEQNRVRIKTLTQRLGNLKAQQQALQSEIKQKYPAYYALKYPQPATAAILQQVLQAGEVILVYGVMTDSTALWIINPEQFVMLTLPAGEEELTEDVSYIRDVILNRLPEMVDEGNPLYEKLIPEAARELLTGAHTLYIVPTGPLYLLPFETLVTHAIDYYIPHYLIQDYAIVYLSSASVLKVLRDTKAQRQTLPSKQLLAFADPAYAPCQDDYDNRAVAKARTVAQLRSNAYRNSMAAVCFPRLPETADEATAIARLFKASDNRLYLGEKANRLSVLNLNKTGQITDYRYLLFAAHGLLPNEVKGLAQSTLVLSKPETFGYLTMADAFTLQLNADFINLSACNTGGGKKIKGEGIMGLTRAFMYAGTPAISVTLWAVESASAQNLSVGIFENIKNGNKPAEALRQIKLKMIAGEANQSYYDLPYYWAPFVLYGDGSQ